MTMTRNDYETMATAFGGVLKEMRDTAHTEKLAGFWLAVAEFTKVAKRGNERFDKERFVNAVIDRSLPFKK
mgnify:CR=1 FL=1